MGNTIQKTAWDKKRKKSVFIGLLIGGLAGAAAILLLASQSGKQTRAKIQQKSNQWRDRTNKFVKNTLAHIRSDTHPVTAGLH
jgi:gas vesicle protein